MMKVTACCPPLLRIEPFPRIVLDLLSMVHLMAFWDWGVVTRAKYFVCTLAWIFPWFIYFNPSPRLTHNIDYLPSKWKICSTVVMH